MAAAALDEHNSKVHSQIIRFKLATDADSASLSPKAAEIIKSEFNLLPTSASDLTDYNDSYLAKHKDCARRVLSALKTRKLLKPETGKDCEKDVVGVLAIDGVTMQEATEGLELLKDWRSGEAETFRSKAAAKWPKATVFTASA